MGAAQRPVEVARPNVHAQLLVDNNTRLWIWSPQTFTCADSAGDGRLLRPGHRQRPVSSTATTAASGGRNGHFDFPAGGGARLG